MITTDQPEQKQFQLKWKSIAIVCMMLCISVLGTTYALGSGDSGNSIPVVIESGSGVETASYIVYKDGDYTCIKNGTSGRIELRTENASLALSSIVGSGPVYLSPGDYEIDYPIQIENDTRFCSNGGTNLISDASLESFFKTKYYDRSTYDSMSPTLLTANAYTGKNVITVAAHTFAVGDYIYIRSDKAWLDTYVNTHADPGYTGDGEILLVKSTTPTTITMAESLVSDYYTAYNARIYPVEMVNDVEFSGINFVGDNSADSAIGIDLIQAANVYIHQCSFMNIGMGAIYLTDVQHAVIDNVNINGSKMSGYGYGVAITRSSYDVRVSNSVISDCNHAVTTGQTSYGIPHYSSVINCVFSRTTVRQHPAGIYQSFYGCVFNEAGLTIENPYTTIDNCRISLSNSNVIQVGSRDWYSHPHHSQIINSEIVAVGNYNTIHVLDGVNLTIKGNTLIQKNWTSGDSVSTIQIFPNWVYNPHNVISDLNILDNKITSARKGITIIPNRALTGITIADNEITSASDAIYQNANYNINELIISRNTISSGRYGAWVVNITDCIIQANIISGMNGVYGLTNTNITDLLIIGNQITASSSDGAIGLFGTNGIVSRISIQDNRITSSTRGIRIQYADNVTISGNVINTGAATGIHIQYDEDTAVSDNVIISSGIDIYSANNIRAVLNGVGTNGAYDPASAGEWYGFAYEGLLVKWNNGATHYLSVYRDGAWYDMTLA